MATDHPSEAGDGGGSENPGVGGSIPSQPTILLSYLPIWGFLRIWVCDQVCDQPRHTLAHSSARSRIGIRCAGTGRER